MAKVSELSCEGRLQRQVGCAIWRGHTGCLQMLKGEPASSGWVQKVKPGQKVDTSGTLSSAQHKDI